jgi:hypothetical protein
MKIRLISLLALAAFGVAVPATANAASPFTDYARAAQAQYGQATTPSSGGVLGVSKTGSSGNSTTPNSGVLPDSGSNSPSSGVLPDSGANDPITTNAGASLPFTGFNLVLLVMLALMLVSAGTLMRAGERKLRRGRLASSRS